MTHDWLVTIYQVANPLQVFLAEAVFAVFTQAVEIHGLHWCQVDQPQSWWSTSRKTVEARWNNHEFGFQQPPQKKHHGAINPAHEAISRVHQHVLLCVPFAGLPWCSLPKLFHRFWPGTEAPHHLPTQDPHYRRLVVPSATRSRWCTDLDMHPSPTCTIYERITIRYLCFVSSIYSVCTCICLSLCILRVYV